MHSQSLRSLPTRTSIHSVQLLHFLTIVPYLSNAIDFTAQSLAKLIGPYPKNGLTLYFERIGQR